MSYKLVASITLALCAGCAADGSEPATSEATEDLMGATQYMSDCTPAARTFIDKTLRYGRAIVASRAYEQCVEQGLRAGVDLWRWSDGTYAHTGPYTHCGHEPFWDATLDEQLQRALTVSRNMNDVQMYCTGGVGGNASAAIGAYEHTTPDVFSWDAGWLNGAIATPQVGAVPFAQAAGTVWHEGMHAHGYTHGSPEVCGYSSETSFDFQKVSMPYIVGDCVSAVLERSATACGNVDSCPNGLRLVSNYDSSACECVTDPTIVGTRSANAFTHITSSANSAANTTTLDNPLLNGHPEATVQFTHVFKPPGTTGHHLGNGLYASYNSQLARWQIISPRGAIPASTGFFVRVGRGVVHRAATGNIIYGYMTRIDDTLADNAPGAVVQVSATPYAGGGTALNDHPLGVYFDAASRHWSIFNQDGAVMPAGAAFTISVETQANRGLHFTHTVTSANWFNSSTMLSSPFLDGNPNARFLITADGTRGPFFDNSDYGVFYAASHWYIYNEKAGAMGDPMPIGVAFDVEILRDENVHYVRVPEGATMVDTGIDLAPGDRVHIHASQQIRTTYPNAPVGPAGLTSWPTPSGYPLSSAPQGALLGHLPSDGNFLVGEDVVRSGPTTTQRLFLTTNDTLRGDGDGFFTAEVRVFR